MTVSSQWKQADKDFFRLTITDNGIGLMPQELEPIRQTLRATRLPRICIFSDFTT